MRLARLRGVWFALAATVLAAPAQADGPKWIWLDQGDTAHFRREFHVPAGATSARVVAACDNEVTLLLDGKPVLESTEWETPTLKDLSAMLIGTSPNKHVLAARCRNQGGAAGLVARLTFDTPQGPVIVATDGTWKASAKTEKGWSGTEFDASKWADARIVGDLGGGPWLAVTAAKLDAAAPLKPPTAASPDRFKVAEGFKVELLYTVPKDEQGSWVSMTTDPKGRLIVADQYGKLYRATPPPLGTSEGLKVEPIDVPLGEAQGLLWAFDRLYVVVNRGQKYPSGLYQVTDTNNDDTLDKVEMLRELDGGGEHGPHAVVLAPDGKSVYVIAGNATALTSLAGSLVPRIWGEDQILPYMPDGRGFMKDERAPGGCVYKVTPDGKEWTLVSMGYRNPYDMAFNKFGDLFTYDSDMEWDVNTPWYRPTRVCQVDSGSDLGYRNGSGKWPAYYPDSLPPTVNIGPGSPTGITFGYGAKFPARYQDALFISDWSYGKLYAVHMTPENSHYAAKVEEFITGTPLPLTDLVINPQDQAMYFAIGGRRTLSGLYRVTYKGQESTDTAPPDDAGAKARDLRHSLEAFHGKADPKALDAAWPHLGHPDRFIRYAARVAVEFQDPATWRDRAVSESHPPAALTALLAVARACETSARPKLMEALAKLDFDKLDLAQKLEMLRVYEVALARMGTPEGAERDSLIARFNPLFPAKSRELNAELCKILVALQAPEIAAKATALMLHAPTQEEQIDYAAALRLLRSGWTPEQHKAYFSWFLTAGNFKGGASLEGFLKQIKTEAVAGLSESQKGDLKPILDAEPVARKAAALAPPRPLVKTWSLEDLAPVAEAGLKQRDYDRGRNLFAAASCFNCHRYDNEGGTVGPDLTGVSGRFGARDLLESIILPSKTISDQYQAVMIATDDGKVITGRIMNLNGDNITVNTDMLDPSAQTNVNAKHVEEIKPSPVSMMPEGLLNTLSQEEILDLMAYVLSRGDRSGPMFK